MLQFGTGFCFLCGVKAKRHSHEIQTQNEAARGSQGRRAKTPRGPHRTSTRRTSNAMKSGFIPAIRCAKKKPDMCCFCIWNAGCGDGGIDFLEIVGNNVFLQMKY